MEAQVHARRVLASSSVEATEALGAALGERLRAGARVALSGEMGVGKTAFVRGLARGLGCEEPVASPSFTLMQRHAGRVPLYHFDAWMEGRERAFLLDGGAECLEADGVAVVEWAERVEEFLAGPGLALELAHLGPSERRIVLAARGSGPKAEALARIVRGLPLPAGMTEDPESGAHGR